MLGEVGSRIFLLAWIPLVVPIFMLLPSRRAMVAATIAGWLILPPDIQIQLPGFPDFGKTTAVMFGLLFGAILFEPHRVFSFRPRWFDLPIIVFAVCPFFSALSNDQTAYEGLSASFIHFMNWLVPYWLGRVYLTDADSFRELGLGIIVSALCLIPCCLVETKYSQIFLSLIYFTSKRGFDSGRYGGFRPRVFFSAGLECALWMCSAALIAWWFWQTRQYKRLWGIPSSAILAILLVIAVLCRSGGAIILLSIGFAALWYSLRFKAKWAMWCLLWIAPLFFALRTTNLWSGESAVEVIGMILGPGRADSLDYRFENDDLLIAKALQRPLFGWSGWGRHMVYSEQGESLAITDGYWIIVFGEHGFVGLISLTLAMLLPAALFLKRFPVEGWKQAGLGAVPVVAVLVDVFMLDCLVNAFPNAIYVVAAGGLFNIVPSRIRPRRSDHANDPRGPVAKTEETLADQYRDWGRASKDRGQLVEAKTAWFHALELYTKLTAAHPGEPALRRQWCDCANDLAWLLVNADEPAVKDPGLALSLALITTERYSECSTYCNTLGACYYRTCDFKAALAALDRSLTLGAGDSAFDHLFLSMAHAQLGDQEQAHRGFAAAMRLIEPHHAERSDLRNLCAEAESLLSALGEIRDTVA